MMSAEFYLFDVGHGQSAALCLPGRRWCIFDVGASERFHPIEWITNKYYDSKSALAGLLRKTSTPFYMATISHYHGDHLADWEYMFSNYPPDILRTVNHDYDYLLDCEASNSEGSWPNVLEYAKYIDNSKPYFQIVPVYGSSISINELCMSPSIARTIGAQSNSRVNNASIITRIDIYGKSILICGDMEKEAWELLLSVSEEWRRHVTDIDILVAPHHGHGSGYSTSLMNYAKPSIVLISAVSKDPSLDSRYSAPPISGLRIGIDSHKYISTRGKHIKVSFDFMDQLCRDRLGLWQFGDEALVY